MGLNGYQKGGDCRRGGFERFNEAISKQYEFPVKMVSGRPILGNPNLNSI